MKVPVVTADMAERLDRSEAEYMASDMDALRTEGDNPLGVEVRRFGGAVALMMQELDDWEFNRVLGLRDQDEEAGFYIAGADEEFHHARVRVDGGDKSLVVWCDEVPEPVAVRYGWSNLPAGGLMNSRELPAYPFRTDTWPMTPHQSTGSYEVGK